MFVQELELAPQSDLSLSAANPLDTHRNTKIVCTLGPASAGREQIDQLLAAGANVVRLNFSHGDHASHSRLLEMVRDVAAQHNAPVAVMQDLCGPKIRVSRIRGERLDLETGDTLRITTEQHIECHGEAFQYDLTSNYDALVTDVEVGQRMLLDDGRVELVVEDMNDQELVARVQRGGRVMVGKGLNLPGAALSVESVTEKDFRDLEWAIDNQVDFVALSFVRHPNDLLKVRKRLDDAKSPIRLIAKIERPEAIEHVAEILELADGLMVARGDLGVETELARVPMLQKALIDRCRVACKPVITATQMLESMVNESMPTRAEVSDVANAIYDGSDAIMLSGETATGRFPADAVKVLNNVALCTEADLARRAWTRRRAGTPDSATAAIIEGAATTAIGLEAKLVIVYSQSGLTARLMARSRLPMPVVTVTNNATTWRQLSLSYGVQPVLLPEVSDMTQLLEGIDLLVLGHRWCAEGDTLVVVSALDGRDGHTDTLHLHRVHAS